MVLGPGLGQHGCSQGGEGGIDPTQAGPSTGEAHLDQFRHLKQTSTRLRSVTEPGPELKLVWFSETDQLTQMSPITADRLIQEGLALCR